MVRLLRPKFRVKENGENDSVIYQRRFKTLCSLVQNVVGTEKVIFLNDTSVSTEELYRTLVEEKVELSDVFILSSIASSISLFELLMKYLFE